MTRPARLWDVYKFFVQQTDPPKEKYVIITHVPDDAQYFLGLFINSIRNPFQQQPHLDPCFIEVPQALHPFLRYDSYAACGEVYTFPRHHLTEEAYQGRIAPATAQDIITGARSCPLLKRRHQDLLTALPLP